MGKEQRGRGDYGELTKGLNVGGEVMATAWGLARRTATSCSVWRRGEQPRKQGETIKRIGEIYYHQVMLGNLVGSMERLPTMVTAAAPDVLYSLRSKNKATELARARRQCVDGKRG